MRGSYRCFILIPTVRHLLSHAGFNLTHTVHTCSTRCSRFPDLLVDFGADVEALSDAFGAAKQRQREAAAEAENAKPSGERVHHDGRPAGRGGGRDQVSFCSTL